MIRLYDQLENQNQPTGKLEIGDDEFDINTHKKGFDYIIYNGLTLSLRKPADEEVHKLAKLRTRIVLDISDKGDLKIALPRESEKFAIAFYEANKGKRNLGDVITFISVEDLNLKDAKELFNTRTNNQSGFTTITSLKIPVKADGGMTVFTQKDNLSGEAYISAVISLADVRTGKCSVNLTRTESHSTGTSSISCSYYKSGRQLPFYADWKDYERIGKHVDYSNDTDPVTQRILAQRAETLGGINAAKRNIVPFHTRGNKSS